MVSLLNVSKFAIYDLKLIKLAFSQCSNLKKKSDYNLTCFCYNNIRSRI